jgi:hypothetical protein
MNMSDESMSPVDVALANWVKRCPCGECQRDTATVSEEIDRLRDRVATLERSNRVLESQLFLACYVTY